MKSIVILYESKSEYAEEKVFDNKSALEKTYAWAQKFASDDCIIKLTSSDSVCQLLEKMSALASEKKADYIIFAYDDLPFISQSITNNLIEQHVKYHSEYTFSDGYPSGFAPEIIDSQAVNIMAKLAAGNLKEAGAKPLTREGLYAFVKNDINAFEVETLIAAHDWRLYRFAFNTGTKRDFLSSLALEKEAKASGIDIDNPDCLAELAASSVSVLKTLPAFYTIEICNQTKNPAIYNPLSCQNYKIEEKKMSFESFSSLIDNISDFSDDAVIALSLNGEAFLHPDIIKFAECVLEKAELSLFIESDGLNLTENFCSALKNIVEKAPKSCKNPYPKLMLALQLDSFSEEGYIKVHPAACQGDYNKAVQTTINLAQLFPGAVYPQFVRMNENEEELEAFFRFWSEKTSPTGGNCLIQKYDDIAGLLPPRKPADLAPLNRFVCWHLRRDMTILANGDFVCCKACMFEKPLANVFDEDLEAAWHKTDDLLSLHIENKLNEKCGKCDEFYTFNF
ncbi:MAG: spiro-SPASM protein [Treponema sp.]|nr:spiro-SPASM protein [Treponema sp.]